MLLLLTLVDKDQIRVAYALTRVLRAVIVLTQQAV